MKCHYKNRDEIIAKYLDRELSDEEVKAFQEHFFQCDICYQEVQLKQDAIELIEDEGNVIFAKAIQKRRKRQKSPLSQLLNQFTPVLKQIPPWAVTFAVLLIIAVGGYWMLIHQGHDDLFATVEYDERVPSPYYPDQDFRGQSEDLNASNSQAIFFDNFQIAMLEYKDKKYQNAVHQFEKLQPDANRLEASAEKTEAFVLLKDYYFYWGVSHFALARSRVIDLSEQVRKRQLEMAVQLLSKADELSQAHQLKDNDKVNYFLGLAYGFAGQTERAVTYLKLVSSNNPPFQDKSKFISRWSE